MWILFLYEINFQFFWVFVYVSLLKKPKNIQTWFQTLVKDQGENMRKELNPIQDDYWGGGRRDKKTSPTSFSPVTLQTLKLPLKTFWLLVLTLLSHWCKISRLYLVTLPNYSTSTNSTPQKSSFFWSSPYKIEVAITSFIETLELPNFGHMNTSTMKLQSRDKLLLVTS